MEVSEVFFPQNNSIDAVHTVGSTTRKGETASTSTQRRRRRGDGDRDKVADYSAKSILSI